LSYWQKGAAVKPVPIKLGLTGYIVAYAMKYEEEFRKAVDEAEGLCPGVYRWYTLAASQGDDLPTKFQTLLEKSMTPNQIAQAQRLAREWIPKGK